MAAVPPRIVVLGAGYGGLYLTLDLARRLRRARVSATITLLDRHNYFLFSPLLHEVTVEMVEMHHVVHPVRQFLRGLPVEFYETGVEGIDLAQRVVRTELRDFPYDYLVLALGSVTNYFGLENVARHSFPLKTLGEAFRLRNHLLSVFEMAAATADPVRRRQLLTFVQAGAGFTGIETITEINDLIFQVLLKDYPMLRPEEIRLLLVDALPGLCTPSSPRLAKITLDLLQRKGIEVRFNTAITDAGAGWVEFAGGERLATATLIWSAGVSANPLVAALPVATGPGKRVHVEPTLQLVGYPEVYALGDNALCLNPDGTPLPTTAQVANQQAPVAALNLFHALTGRSPRPFRYHRLGELASLGLYNAIAELGPFQFSGFLAWWIWRTIYLVKMPWWADRFSIAADWTIDLFFSRDTSRIEVGDCPACPQPHCPRQLPAPEREACALSVPSSPASPDNP